MGPDLIKSLAYECGFELAGVAPAEPLPDADYYADWVASGFAGEMTYLTDGRGEIRRDPRNLLPSARSVICVGKLYNGPEPHSNELNDLERAWISRYAWGKDYHDVLRKGLEALVGKLKQHVEESFEWKICVDTAPLLERSYAQRAGLGWIGKNACLINQEMGSWFFLGELLVSLSIEPGVAPPDRCGTCTHCIDACPTAAIIPTGRTERPAYTIDSRRCIAYFTIELQGAVPPEMRHAIGNQVFGCDICQDVCPWNSRAPVSPEPAFRAAHFAPPLEALVAISEQEFRAMFRHTPVTRARYSGFLRNVAIAMANSGLKRFRSPLEKLASSEDPVVAEHARWGLEQL